MISTKTTTGPAHPTVVTATKLSLGTNQHNVPIEARAHPNPRHHGFRTRFARKTTSLPPTKHRRFVNLTPLRSVRHGKRVLAPS